MSFIRLMLMLVICSLVSLGARAEVLLSVNDVAVTDDDLYFYLKEFLAPQAYESGVQKT